MTAQDLSDICHSLPGVTEDLKWGDNLCFAVGGKLFLIISLDSVPVNASFRVKEEDFEYISCQDGFSPAPYFARYSWVMVDDIGIPGRREWEKYITEAYGRVKAGLPKKTRDRIEGIQ